MGFCGEKCVAKNFLVKIAALVWDTRKKKKKKKMIVICSAKMRLCIVNLVSRHYKSSSFRITSEWWTLFFSKKCQNRSFY